MTDANLVVERRTIAVGDRIEYRIYNRKHGIASHEFATVMKWDGKEATLKFDGGRILKGSLSPHIDLGYCSTVHSAQGGTIDRVIVNLDSMRAGRLINRQAFYVALSLPHHSRTEFAFLYGLRTPESEMVVFEAICKTPRLVP